jgi:hypothetical protein
MMASEVGVGGRELRWASRESRNAVSGVEAGGEEVG